MGESRGRHFNLCFSTSSSVLVGNTLLFPHDEAVLPVMVIGNALLLLPEGDAQQGSSVSGTSGGSPPQTAPVLFPSLITTSLQIS